MDRKEFLIISFTIFLTVLAWVLSDVYHIAKMKRILRNLPSVSSLNIEFDEKVFDNLRLKTYE